MKTEKIKSPVKRTLGVIGWLPWLMILPVIIIRCLTTLYPVLMTFINSFRDLHIIGGGTGAFAGLKNYAKLLSDEKIASSMQFTILFTIISMTFHIVLGVILAMMLNMKFKGKKFLRTIVLIPWAMPMIVAGRAARWGFNGTYGFVNDLIGRLVSGFHYDWLIHVDAARLAVIIVDLWKDIPFFAILVLASLQFVSADIYEAAKIDGAGAVKSFFYITIPSILKTVMTISIFFTMWRITSFELVYAMTSGGPYDGTSVLSYRILIEAFNNLNLGYASAIAVVLFLIMLVLTGINLFAIKKISD
ncbi:carbohydrate ABC transporter permease [Hungatella sp. SB206]|uniref:carbohydrate ABC transporter permease n=1 Tax=Hungatella sp. SB206 TaxID=2937758 RepID=UPI003DAA3ED3